MQSQKDSGKNSKNVSKKKLSAIQNKTHFLQLLENFKLEIFRNMSIHFFQ
jgi:hypothetical protein